MTSIGWATLDVIPSFKGLASELEKGSSGPLRDAGVKGGTQFGDAAGKAGGSRFGTVFKRAAQASLVGVAALGAGAIKLAMDSVSAASDLEESTNKVAQVFGDAADSVFKFTETTADALGQTNTQAREAAATFGIFGSAAGLADKKNARFAKRMTTLASDLASFNNTDPSQAVEALGAALRGESEPIRAYGVMLDEATLKAEALALGILKPVKDQSKIMSYQVRITEGQLAYNEAVKEYGKDSLEALKAEANLGTLRTSLQKATEGVIPPLTQQQKLLAAQSQIFKQTEVAQGDFARTSGGLANQQRRLSARFDDAKAKLGTGLLPIMTDAADFLLDKGIPAFEDFSAWFSEDGIPALKKFGDKVQDVAGFVKDLAGQINDLPASVKSGGLAALIGGGIAIKAKGTSNSLFGGRGGRTNPAYVTVTNAGFNSSSGPGIDGKPGKTPPGAKLNGALSLIPLIPAVDALLKDNKITGAADDLGKKTHEFFVGLKDFIPDTGKDTGAAPDSFSRLPQNSINGNDLDAVRTTILERKLDGIQSKAGKFGETLDLIGNKKVDPSLTIRGMARADIDLQKFLGQQIEARKPITPYVTLTGYDRAMAMIRTLKTELHSIPGAGVDNGLTYASGGGTSAGIVNNFTGPINATDTKDITRQAQKKQRERGLGGRPMP